LRALHLPAWSATPTTIVVVPVYEFLCPECGTRFEELATVGTDRMTCPNCGSRDSKRVLSQFAEPAHLVKSPGQARKMEARRRDRREERSRARARGGEGG
jgi:putative FmdB family regulatory protein